MEIAWSARKHDIDDADILIVPAGKPLQVIHADILQLKNYRLLG